MSLSRIIAEYRRWTVAQQTEESLAKLSRRELDDLGIMPGDIHEISLRAGRWAAANDTGTRDAA